MADVSKIKLPNNSKVNIKDYRIPGVDNTPTSGSDNVVTSDGIYNALREDNPLYTKTYTYKCAAATEAEGYIYFLNVHPESSEWSMPWQVHYTLTVDCPDSSENANVKYCNGEYDVYMGCAGSNVYYHIFNKFYSSSYYPLYQHKLLYHNSEAKYNNKSTYPAKCGARILSAWNSNTITRKYTIKVYDLLNCTISFPENIETHGNVYNADNYGVADFSGTGRGLQETGDSDTPNYYNYEYYVGYRVHSAETPLYRYKFVGFDNRNRIIPINITNQTSTTIINKTPCSVPMIVSRGLALYNTTTAITDASTAIATGVLYRDTSIANGILQYNFNEVIGNSSNSSVSTDLYLAGTYNYETDEFTLDTTDYTSYYTTANILTEESEYYSNFTEGKFYWWLGQCPVSSNYFNFQNIHPLYYFNGTKLIEVHSQEFKNISDQLFVYAQSLNDLNTNKENLSNKVTSISNVSTNTEYPSAAAVVGYVTNCVDTALASALQYKGTVASNSNLPATHKVGWVYVVSTAGTFAGKSCEVGDYIICKTAGTSANNAHWDVVNGENQVENKSASLAAAGSSATIATVDGTNITVTTPSTWTGVAKTGTVTSVTLKGTSPIVVDSESALTTSGTRTVSHANSGVTAGTYKSVTVNATGHVTAGTNPTTLSGYGITDAKIASGTITLGSNTITPLTSNSTLDATKLSGTIPSSCYTDNDTKNTAGSTDSSSKLFLIGATSQAANPQTYSQDTAYVGTDGHLYSNSKQVVNLSDTQALTNKTYNGYTLAAACAKSVVTSIDTSASLPTSNAVKTYVDSVVPSEQEALTTSEIDTIWDNAT